MGNKQVCGSLVTCLIMIYAFTAKSYALEIVASCFDGSNVLMHLTIAQMPRLIVEGKACASLNPDNTVCCMIRRAAVMAIPMAMLVKRYPLE